MITIKPAVVVLMLFQSNLWGQNTERQILTFATKDACEKVRMQLQEADKAGGNLYLCVEGSIPPR